jgi:hypothetical protein
MAGGPEGTLVAVTGEAGAVAAGFRVAGAEVGEAGPAGAVATVPGPAVATTAVGAATGGEGAVAVGGGDGEAAGWPAKWHPMQVESVRPVWSVGIPVPPGVPTPGPPTAWQAVQVSRPTVA